MTDDLPGTITLSTGVSTSLPPHTSPLTCEIRMKFSHWGGHRMDMLMALVRLCAEGVASDHKEASR